MRVNSNKDEKSRFQETNLNVPGEIAVMNSCPNCHATSGKNNLSFPFFFSLTRQIKFYIPTSLKRRVTLLIYIYKKPSTVIITPLVSKVRTNKKTTVILIT